MKIVRCDRCGRVIPRGETYAIIHVNCTDPLRGPMFKDDALGNDLCDECARELGEWLHEEQYPSN